ncbi:hypothetical protein E2A64_10110 [Pseudohoeflea suaedae]|uniref:Uncharacterized protein n=1 Tax=Pseudohoeflea suaedae TaxID=877384 RepID=A0A4R5PJD7_9HYPH|nr:hypothetical protein [Pseudohoeflea suaedae]TDH35685.1 hypothetical protein E2A64_10110 [Pseudohoeflea suaedae]
MTDVERMRAMQAQGESLSAIGREFGISPTAVFYKLGGERKRREPQPDNTKHPDRVTRYGAYNGGCSTRSGMRPTTLVRIPTIDGPAETEAA